MQATPAEVVSVVYEQMWRVLRRHFFPSDGRVDFSKYRKFTYTSWVQTNLCPNTNLKVLFNHLDSENKLYEYNEAIANDALLNYYWTQHFCGRNNLRSKTRTKLPLGAHISFSCVNLQKISYTHKCIVLENSPRKTNPLFWRNFNLKVNPSSSRNAWNKCNWLMNV